MGYFGHLWVVLFRANVGASEKGFLVVETVHGGKTVETVLIPRWLPRQLRKAR